METLAALPLTWLDWTLLAVLLVSVLVGLMRGFVFECLSLAGWLVAWFSAQWLAPQLAPHLAAILPVGAAGSVASGGAAFTLAFVGVLLVWALLAKLVRMLIQATPLSVPDRLLGAGFGLLRGGVLLLAMATLISYTPAAQSASWQGAQSAVMLSRALHALKPLLPEEAARWLPNPKTGAPR